MERQLDGLAIFSTEKYGFDREQVGQYLAELHQKYERLRRENLRLEKKLARLEKLTKENPVPKNIQRGKKRTRDEQKF